MLRFKLSKAPPEKACLLGYYTGTDFLPATNLGLKDTSWEWAENRTGIELQARCVNFDPGNQDIITSPEVVVGNVSARRLTLTEATPLPWAHRIGNNTDLGATRQLLYAPLVDGINPGASTNASEQALNELRKAIKVLEVDGTESTIIWDLGWNTVAAGNRRVAVGASYGWDIHLYLPIQTTRERPLYVSYNAINADTGTITYNKRELINTVSAYTGGAIIEPGDPIPGTDHYALELNDDSTYFAVDDGTQNSAMAIAFWTEQDDWTWDIAAGELRILLLGVAQGSNVVLAGKTVKQVVQAVNDQNFPVKATLLLDYPTSPFPNQGPFDITAWGSNPIYFPNHFFAWYPYDTKMFLVPPRAVSRSDEWNPIVNAGPVRQTISSGVLSGYVMTYRVPEREWMPFSSRYNIANGLSVDYLESYREPVSLIRGDLLALQNRNVLMESVRVFVNNNDATPQIIDYDKTSGLLQLSRDVLTADSVEVTYAYDPKFEYVMDSLNLNPGQLHIPEGYKLYWGIYVTPSTITPPIGPAVDLEPTVGWVVGNTIAEVETAVAAIMDPTGTFAIQAKLLGVFQSSSQADETDVKILDIRSWGGGIKQNADMTKITADEPETQFYDDIGYIEGEPYAGQGVIVVNGPASILGNDTTLSDIVAPSDGGFVDTTGKQNLDDIRRRLKDHVTAGMYPVVDLE